ncbi:MAG: sel1 repeat family protein, partial [Lentisphaeria bacterium]|nr:sel1 repeat family protein [Lentisphaeria bacterium]
AFRYMKGLGVDADFNKAYAYALKASEHGDMLGRAILGAYYLTIKKDIKRGVKLIRESAESGNPGGQYMLFRCLYYSKEIEKNKDLAMKILKMSADQGFPDSVSKWNNLNKRNEERMIKKNIGKNK